jgi:hypothetical protein
MTRESVFAIAFVLTASTVAAQTAAPVQSFRDLQPLVTSGQEVTVWLNNGRKARGIVVSLIGDKLELRRRPPFWGRDRHDVYAESAATRIDDRDSTLNGRLIGVGLGLLVSVVAYRTADPNDDDLPELPYVVFSPVVGLFIGGAIDAAINRTLFVSPAAKRVTLRPVVGGKGDRVVGAMATIRF